MPVKKFATSLRNDVAAIYLPGHEKKKKDGYAREDAKKNDYRATIKGDSRSFAARWMDIKKTMNVAIERVHDLLTKGTGAVKYEGRAGERTFGVGERRRGKLIFAILVLRNWLLMFYSSADNGGAEAIPRGEKVVRLRQGSRISGVTLSLRARRSSFLEELLP